MVFVLRCAPLQTGPPSGGDPDVEALLGAVAVPLDEVQALSQGCVCGGLGGAGRVCMWPTSGGWGWEQMPSRVPCSCSRSAEDILELVRCRLRQTDRPVAGVSSRNVFSRGWGRVGGGGGSCKGPPYGGFACGAGPPPPLDLPAHNNW